jgi:hypothetical protein
MRNSRVAALQRRWDRPRAGLDLILDQRGADLVDIPGGASGLLVRGYTGKEADRLVTRLDPVVVSLVSGLRGHERQAAEELEQWKTHHKEPKRVDASPAAITLALLLTDEELDSLEEGLEMEKSRGADDLGGSDVASPQPAARHGEPAQVFRTNAAAADGRPRLDSVICGSRIRPERCCFRVPIIRPERTSVNAARQGRTLTRASLFGDRFRTSTAPGTISPSSHNHSVVFPV